MTNTNCPDNLTLNNEEIKQVKDFTYLGSKMASTDNDVKRRLGLLRQVKQKPLIL